MTGMPEQGSVLSYQAEVHPPCVDPHRGDVGKATTCDAQALKYFAVQVEYIPIQFVENAHRPIGKTVNNIQLDLFSGPTSSDESPTFGT